MVQPRDAMQFVNEQDSATLEQFVKRLELRGRDPRFVVYRDAYHDLVELPRTLRYWTSGAARAS